MSETVFAWNLDRLLTSGSPSIQKRPEAMVVSASLCLPLQPIPRLVDVEFWHQREAEQGGQTDREIRPTDGADICLSVNSAAFEL